MAEEVADDVGEEGEDVGALSWKDALRHSKLSIIVWIVFITTFFACTFGGADFLIYSVGGYAWILCFAFSVMVIPANFDRISFPLYIWLPWGLFVILSGYVSDYTNLQRSTLLLCPIVVGMAASAAKIDEEQLLNFGILMRVFSVALLFLATFLTGLLLTGQLPGSTGLAPQAITALLLASFFVSGYSFGRVRDLLWWGAVVMLPVLALTRMAIFVSGLSLPFTFSPLKFRLRIILSVVVALLGLALFYTPRVQEKMFMKGEGTLKDIGDEKNLETSGRRHIAEVLLIEIAQKPWWGHGANASEELILKLSEGQLTHPHNDWLRFLYRLWHRRRCAVSSDGNQSGSASSQKGVEYRGRITHILFCRCLIISSICAYDVYRQYCIVRCILRQSSVYHYRTCVRSGKAGTAGKNLVRGR